MAQAALNGAEPVNDYRCFVCKNKTGKGKEAYAMKSYKILWLVLIIVVLFWTGTSFAAMSNEEMVQKLNELSTIIQNQQQEIQKLKQDLENQKKTITQDQKARKKEIKEIVSAQTEEKAKEWRTWIPRWVSRIKVSGDLRLRYEGIYNREERQSDGSTKDIDDRNRYRIRARLFFDAPITNEVSTHFMICTNQDSNREATTTNQTFTDDFNDKGIYLHRAYATYKPGWFKGLELTAGKFKNTFLHTDIMWDPDVNPEGVYERYQYKGFGNFQPFIHLGQMAVTEVNNGEDAALYINQAGFNWKIGPVKWILAGSYYNWQNLENTKYLHTADYKKGGGNTFINVNGTLQYAYDYDLWEGISFISFKLGPVPTKLIFDYIVNTADDVPDDQDTAYYLGFTLGKTKHKGDWSLAYKYARIEKDALIGSMNDQDFYGANRKGHKIKFRYMLFDHLQFGVAYFNTDPVYDWNPASVTFSKNKSREHEDRLQTDFIFKF